MGDALGRMDRRSYSLCHPGKRKNRETAAIRLDKLPRNGGSKFEHEGFLTPSSGKQEELDG
jgi:hypothetical protein